MKMHALSGGRLRMRKSVYLPTVEKTETIELPVICYLIRHEQGNILFDTGCHPSVAENAEDRWGSMAKVMVPINAPQDNLIAQLDLVGLKPHDIDLVVNSHFHSDHCGCNTFFKKATVICHARELEAAQAQEAEKMGFLPVDWKHEMPVETIDGPKDLFNDGRIVLIPVPGHTPGMTGARIELSRSGAFFLASDAVALQDNLERDLNPRNTWNTELSSQSMKEIRKMQAEGVRVLFGHDDKQYQSLRKGQEHYD